MDKTEFTNKLKQYKKHRLPCRIDLSPKPSRR